MKPKPNHQKNISEHAENVISIPMKWRQIKKKIKIKL